MYFLAPFLRTSLSQSVSDTSTGCFKFSILKGTPKLNTTPPTADFYQSLTLTAKPLRGIFSEKLLWLFDVHEVKFKCLNRLFQCLFLKQATCKLPSTFSSTPYPPLYCLFLCWGKHHRILPNIPIYLFILFTVCVTSVRTYALWDWMSVLFVSYPRHLQQCLVNRCSADVSDAGWANVWAFSFPSPAGDHSSCIPCSVLALFLVLSLHLSSSVSTRQSLTL